MNKKYPFLNNFLSKVTAEIKFKGKSVLQI